MEPDHNDMLDGEMQLHFDTGLNANTRLAVGGCHYCFEWTHLPQDEHWLISEQK